MIFDVIFGEIGLMKNRGKSTDGDLLVIGDDGGSQLAIDDTTKFEMTASLRNFDKTEIFECLNQLPGGITLRHK